MSPPSAEAVAVWGMGALTVAQAAERFGLNRNRLFELMGEQVVRWKFLEGHNTRLLSWADLVAYVAALPDGGGPDWTPRPVPKGARAK